MKKPEGIDFEPYSVAEIAKMLKISQRDVC